MSSGAIRGEIILALIPLVGAVVGYYGRRIIHKLDAATEYRQTQIDNKLESMSNDMISMNKKLETVSRRLYRLERKPKT